MTEKETETKELEEFSWEVLRPYFFRWLGIFAVFFLLCIVFFAGR